MPPNKNQTGKDRGKPRPQSARSGNDLERIQSRLARVSAVGLSDYMSALAKDESVPLDQRLETLRDIQTEAETLIEAIRPRVPLSATTLWRDREVKDEDPYAFAHRVYAECIGIITKTDIERLDKTLFNQMNIRDRTIGRPGPDLYIPTKHERNDPVVRQVTWAEILEAAPEHVKVLLRAYGAKGNRASRAKSP